MKEHQQRAKGFAKRLGAEIAAVREAMKWPQTELADRLGVTREAVSFMERGHLKSIDFETLALVYPLMERCPCCGTARAPLQVEAARAVADRTRRRKR